MLDAASTAAPTTPEIDVVHAFLAALERLDIDAALELADPNVVYQNVPFPPARGVKAVGRQLRLMARYGSGFEVVMHNIAVDRHVVLTERTDVLVIGPVRAAFWVCGTFEVRDGRITLWRDRFDFADVTVAFLKGLVRALLRR